LNKRIAIALDKYNKPEGILIYTFHAYGKEIIRSVENRVPSISKFADSKKVQISKLFSEIIGELISSDPQFLRNWIEYLTIYKKPLICLERISSQSDYDLYLSALGAKRKQGEQRLVINTLDGNEVKSIEEARIANWLYLKGVNYKYEKPYKIGTATEHRRQYYPDFYYPEANLYHEHFALNREGQAPPFFKDYVQGVNWKRNTHQANNTNLIETYSYQVREGTIFNTLEKHLIEHGVKFNPLTLDQLKSKLKEIFNPKSDFQLFTTFLQHFKSNNECIKSLKIAIEGEEFDRNRNLVFLNVFERFYGMYQQKLSDHQEIDFQDMLHIASDYLESSKFSPNLKFVLVDEFQDMSYDKKRFLSSIVNQNDRVYLFAVGDDWQSIYRFSGADISVMTNFSKHYVEFHGGVYRDTLCQTFRCSQIISDTTAEFIQRNPMQIKKDVISCNNFEQSEIRICKYKYRNDYEDKLKAIIIEQDQMAKKNNEEIDILLLGRYNFVNPSEVLKSFEISNLERTSVKFMTIHKSKGLEADYVILLRLEGGEYGFPCFVQDDPILQFVLPEPEPMDLSEERRLLYVALTRAKRSVYIMQNERSQSAFTEELNQLLGEHSEEKVERNNKADVNY
jgi:DNA helicase IV